MTWYTSPRSFILSFTFPLPLLSGPSSSPHYTCPVPFSPLFLSFSCLLTLTSSLLSSPFRSLLLPFTFCSSSLLLSFLHFTPPSFLRIYFQDTSTTGKQQTRTHHITTTTTRTHGKLGFWRQGQVPPRVSCSHGKLIQHPSGYKLSASSPFLCLVQTKKR